MANEKHVLLLSRGVTIWNQWRDENPGILPDLAEADLRGADLQGADLNRADLRGVDLSGEDRSGEELFRKADFSGDDLIAGSDLSMADLSMADLNGANLNRVHLNSADLTGADLSNADLSKADLSWANIRSANLSRANLSEALLISAIIIRTNLSEAFLKEASLDEARLHFVNLSRADLSRASLTAADFSGVDLSQAQLSGARIGNTSFSDMALSEVIGLDKVEHLGPSSIGIDTIYRSQGIIPEVFLRGCGLPETFITYIRSLTGEPIQFYSCFISYSHADRSFARRLHDALQGQGIRCWLDEKQVLPGDDIYEQVDRGIRLWDKVLLCCSKDALTSWWVDNEIDTAFNKERRLMKERGKKVLALIPLDLDGYLFSDKWENGKKGQVLSRLAPDFTNWDKDNDKFETQLEKVVKALRTDDRGREPPPEPRL